ncbi:Hypothetical_protein [Hexamita inflata]|uniref:Hypothetical_protein n=1 Tax=Hexamita inflata TaxID=28002 RepID=A0AA86TPQ0_9EUKA|nr:Hypothetical protein HINF_LOCUS6603 [Hexamita inflata]
MTTNQQYITQQITHLQQNLLQINNDAMINNSIQNADIISLYAAQDIIKAEIAVIKNTLSNLNTSGSSNITLDREYTCSIQGLVYSNGRCTCPAVGQIFYNSGCKCTAFLYNPRYTPGFCIKLQQCCQNMDNSYYYCTDNKQYNNDQCGFLT